MDFKVCSKCKQEKPLTEFHKDKTKKSGYKSQCKTCISTNESIKSRLKEYRQNHKEYYKEKHAEYRARNREKLKRQAREYRAKNPDATRVYYIKNRDRILERCREYNHSERGRLVRQKYRKSETVKANKSYRKHIARATDKNGSKDITLLKLYERDNGICKICGRPCDYEDYILEDNVFIAGNNYPSIDHIKPLNKGGLHTWDNVQLTHRICNCIKKDKES